ncbi:MAG: hypothetical protein DHS20C14_16790 [Phycisphaeraceae bacterium]|nr:MAG: hypothetical protein DHS20C14_16790 [Phycisphaeraceae bacterium]
MRTMILCSAMTCCAATASPALAQPAAHLEHAEAAPVNAMCPIGKEPIVPSAGTVMYNGKEIGLCCPGCGEQFLAWDESRKNEFVALAVAHLEPGHEASPEQPALGTSWTDPYPLDSCPVGGGMLGSMGEPVVKVYDGREVRFCCAGCIDKFEADKAGYWSKIDEQIVKDQLPYYPMQTCVVMGDPLIEDGEDIAINTVYGNRLVRLCCKMCVREFNEDPTAFIEKLDQAATDAQRDAYPLTTCIVGGGELGSMGEPTEMVVAGRLFRFCCAGCEPKVVASPAEYIAPIDAAWHAQGRFMPADHDASAEHHEEGHAGDDDHGHDHGDHNHDG